LTTGEISAHFAEIYGASVSKDTVSRITDKVIEDMQAWASRPLQRVYAAVFIDAIMVKVRDGQVGNQPFYAAIGGRPGRAPRRSRALAGPRRRGVGEVLDGCAHRAAQPGRGRRLLPPPQAGGAPSLRRVERAAGLGERRLPQSIVQTGIVHLIRGTFRYASKRYWEAIAKDLRPIYTAPDAKAAWAAFEEFEEKWGKAYPAIPKLWRAAAMKTLYLVTRSLDPKGLGQARWVTRWKPALNAFAVTFADRMPAAENL